jgi:hypothetical protein
VPDTTTTIDTDVWEPDTERPGYLKHVRQRTVGEVYDDLQAALGIRQSGPDFHLPDGCNEYFSLMVPRGTDWPRNHRTVAYAVTGGSEGWYVHVSTIDYNGTGGHQTLILGKTFDGWDEAWGFAKKLGELLAV